jgi:hypothetical protein
MCEHPGERLWPRKSTWVVLVVWHPVSMIACHDGLVLGVGWCAGVRARSWYLVTIVFFCFRIILE